jgi:hypothetical protein
LQACIIRGVKYTTVIKGFEARARRMLALRREKRWTLSRIGRHYGVSPQRVAQILERFGKEVA